MTIQENLTPFEALTMDLLITSVADFSREDIFKMATGLEEIDSLFEGNVNEAEMEEVAGVCGIIVNQAKGVLSSLSQKGYVWLDEEDGMLCPTMDGVKALVQDVKRHEAFEGA